MDCTSFRGSLLELRDQLLRQRQTLTVSRPFKPVSASRLAHAGERVSCRQYFSHIRDGCNRSSRKDASQLGPQQIRGHRDLSAGCPPRRAEECNPVREQWGTWYQKIDIELKVTQCQTAGARGVP